MESKFVLLFLVVLSTCAAREHEDEHNNLPAHYSYAYEVQDHKTEDLKNHHEEREGDHTQGEYSLIEPDGTKRVVKYTVDGKSGFNAIVTREGKNVKETYYYGGKSGGSFEHKGSLVHDTGNSNNVQYGHGQSHTSHSSQLGGDSSKETQGNLMNQYTHSSPNHGQFSAIPLGQHGSSSQGELYQQNQHVPINTHQSNLHPQGGSGNQGGSFSYFSSKQASTDHQQRPAQGNLIVHHGAPQVVAFIAKSEESRSTQEGPQHPVNHVIHYGQQGGHQPVQQQVIQHGGNIANAQGSHQGNFQHVINKDAGNAYYNLNHQNSQRLNHGGLYHHNSNQDGHSGQAQQVYNENFHHPVPHDFRGHFIQKVYGQQGQEERKQQIHNPQSAGNAQPGLQQFFYNSQDEMSHMAQAVQNNGGHPSFNPQIHLANQINSYNQQQQSKLYQVKPMMDERLMSQGIILYYGKNKQFSNQNNNMGHHTASPGVYGTYVQFHGDRHNMNHQTHGTENTMSQQAYGHGQNMNQHNLQNINNQANNDHHIISNHQNGHSQASQNNNDASLYSNHQGGDGYATSYQNFSVKGAKVFVSTKHIVPKKHSN